MEPKTFTAVTASWSPSSTSKVVNHDVVFHFILKAIPDGNVLDEKARHKAVPLADVALFLELPARVSHWRFVDSYQVECSRLELYMPEYGDDEGLPPDTSLYEIGVTANREIPLSKADATDEFPLSIEQLVSEAPPQIEEIYARYGISLTLHKVTFAKKIESTLKGSYFINQHTSED